MFSLAELLLLLFMCGFCVAMEGCEGQAVANHETVHTNAAIKYLLDFILARLLQKWPVSEPPVLPLDMAICRAPPCTPSPPIMARYPRGD